MNSTSNETNTPTRPSGPEDPWVESGALVYVAITVAVCAAVIMCCTWFLTTNETTKAIWKKYFDNKTKYNEISHDEEEEIELRPNKSPQDSDNDEEDISASAASKSSSRDVFTLEDEESDEDINLEALEPKDAV